MHCVDIILVKKSEIRDAKIMSILDNRYLNLDSESTDCIVHINLPCDIIAFPDMGVDEVVNKLGEGIEFLHITTDYFGGVGDQDATKYTNNGYINFMTINQALAAYGVRGSEGLDAFDTIHLGRYRTNEDYIKEFHSKKIIKHIIENTKSF